MLSIRQTAVGAGGPAVEQQQQQHVRDGALLGKTPPTTKMLGGEARAGLLRPTPEELRRLLRTDSVHTLYQVHPTPFATGQFAEVRLCVERASGREGAAKFSSRVRLGEDCTAELRHEAALLSRCGACERFPALLHAFITPQHVVMVTEYLPGGDLQAVLDADALPFESDARRYLRQLLQALQFLHGRLGAAHLDIKPQNLVLTAPFPRGDVKLCDLEVARVVVARAPVRELLGTPDYVAPEILHYEPITLAADLWSSGVTAYALLTGFSPFGGETDQETFCNVARAQVDFPDELFADTSKGAVKFIRRLLVRDPGSRPTAAECLKDPWLQSTKEEGSATGTPTGSRGSGELRRFLSRSREALVERARGLRGALSQSQMSLSRSREKLYGLRSLSQSQDLLQLLGGGSGAAVGSTAKGTGIPAPLLAAALARAAAASTSTPALTTSTSPPAASSVPDLSAADDDVASETTCIADVTTPAVNGEGVTGRLRCVSESAAAAPATTPEVEDNSGQTTTLPLTPPMATKQAESETLDSRNMSSLDQPSPSSSPGGGDLEEEERRFSVAQLVRAFDSHQRAPCALRKGTAALRAIILQMEADESPATCPRGPPRATKGSCLTNH